MCMMFRNTQAPLFWGGGGGGCLCSHALAIVGGHSDTHIVSVKFLRFLVTLLNTTIGPWIRSRYICHDNQIATSVFLSLQLRLI